MSWMVEATAGDSIKYYIVSGMDSNGPFISFFLKDAEAIKNEFGDSDNLSRIMQKTSQFIDELSTVKDFENIEIPFYFATKGIENYIEMLSTIINSRFSSDALIIRAQKELSKAIEIVEEKERNKIKREHTKKRRSEFQSKHSQLMLALIERDGCECARCGSIKNLSIDHVVPLSRGGSDDLLNLVILCSSCNSKKSDKV